MKYPNKWYRRNELNCKSLVSNYRGFILILVPLQAFFFCLLNSVPITGRMGFEELILQAAKCADLGASLKCAAGSGVSDGCGKCSNAK